MKIVMEADNLSKQVEIFEYLIIIFNLELSDKINFSRLSIDISIYIRIVKSTWALQLLDFNTFCLIFKSKND